MEYDIKKALEVEINNYKVQSLDKNEIKVELCNVNLTFDLKRFI